MGGEAEGGGRSPVQVVREVMAAMTDGRELDVLALVDPRVEWRTIVRPGRSAYYGRAEMPGYLADLRAAFGRFRVDVDDITSDGAQVTVRLHVMRQGDDEPMAVTAEFTVRDGLISRMESQAGASIPAA